MVWIPTDDSSSTDAGTSAATTNYPAIGSSTGSPTGAIAGGVVGAVALLGLVALFFFLLGRRNRKVVSSTSSYTNDKRAGVKGVDSTNGAASTERITNDTELNDLAPANLATSAPLRTEKSRREPGAAVRATISSISSNGNLPSSLPTNIPDEVDIASQTWITSPPAYDQLVPPSSTPLSREKM